jgi:hypothetical protein
MSLRFHPDTSYSRKQWLSINITPPGTMPQDERSDILRRASTKDRAVVPNFIFFRSLTPRTGCPLNLARACRLPGEKTREFSSFLLFI